MELIVNNYLLIVAVIVGLIAGIGCLPLVWLGLDSLYDWLKGR